MDVVFRLTLESAVGYFLLGYVSYFLWRFLRVLCIESFLWRLLLWCAASIGTNLQCFVAFGGVCKH